MLQDMGIDVFFSRQRVNDSAAQASTQDQRQAEPQSSAQAQTSPMAASEAGMQQPSPAFAARAALAEAAPAPSASEQELAGRSRLGPGPASTDAHSRTVSAQADTDLTLELSFVATASLVWVGDGPLSDLELRFLQDLAGALHQAVAGAVLQDRVRNSDFRWPIVESSGTPQRAVTVFCEKHRMLSPGIAVIGTTSALQTLKTWLDDGTNHWLTVDGLAQTAAQGESKRALWQQLLERVLAST